MKSERFSVRSRSIVVCSLLAGLGCRGGAAPESEPVRPQEEDPPIKAGSELEETAGDPSTPAPSPLDLGPLRPYPEAEEQNALVVEPVAYKDLGVVGERLEVNTHGFRLLRARPCGKAAGDHPVGQDLPERLRRTPIAFEVEIEAKTKLSVSPRDVVLRSGGIFFYADLDLEKQLEGCTPRLQHGRLKRGVLLVCSMDA